MKSAFILSSTPITYGLISPANSKEDLFSRSRQKVKSDARALFCFWAHRELGYGQRELARRLGISQPGVAYYVIKGEAISKSNNYQIKD